MKKAVAMFYGDPSVGISSYSFDLTVPDFEPEYREETRKMIQELYTQLDGEFVCKVMFEDEWNEPDLPSEIEDKIEEADAGYEEFWDEDHEEWGNGDEDIWEMRENENENSDDI